MGEMAAGNTFSGPAKRENPGGAFLCLCQTTTVSRGGEKRGAGVKTLKLSGMKKTKKKKKFEGQTTDSALPTGGACARGPPPPTTRGGGNILSIF